MQEIFEWTKDTKEQQDQQFKECKQSMETQCKQYFNLSKTGQSNSKETEKRLIYKTWENGLQTDGVFLCVVIAVS